LRVGRIEPACEHGQMIGGHGGVEVVLDVI